MATRRTYGQYCGIARALDLVGDRWGLLVVRELVLGPKRFTDLRRGLPGIATNVLTERLKQLEGDEVVRRRVLPPPAATTVYELTEFGRELEPVLLAFGRWGAKRLGALTAEEVVQAGWFAVAMKAYFQADAARDVQATIDLGLDGERYALCIDRGRLEITTGAPEQSDLSVTCGLETMIGFLHGAEVPAAALAAEGDFTLLDQLPRIFSFAERGAHVETVRT